MLSKEILKDLSEKEKDQLFSLTLNHKWMSDNDFLACRDFAAWVNKSLLEITGKNYNIKNDKIADAIMKGLTK